MYSLTLHTMKLGQKLLCTITKETVKKLTKFPLGGRRLTAFVSVNNEDIAAICRRCSYFY